MRLTALVTACLVTVALAGPVPQGPYLVRAPQNALSLHSQARQRNINSGGQQQFIVSLDSRENSREDALLSLQGVGNFAATSSQAPVFPSIQTSQGPPQEFNIGGGAQFNVEIDDNSRESGEFRLSSFASPVECPAGQLRHGSRCVVPKINRNIFVFGKDDPPEQKSIDSSELPLPELDYNIIFVRSRSDRQRSPIVVPPAQKKTVVYVLEDEDVDKDVIEVPAYPDADPEVYYVKVRPGENPQLPGGLDLETAYSQAIRPSDSQETSFESSIELNIGAGGSVSAAGTDTFSGSAQGAATFNSGDAGFSSNDNFGVPLLAFSGTGDDQGFSGGDAGFGSSSNGATGGNAGFGSSSNGATGGNAGFGSSSNGATGGNAGFGSSSNGATGGDAGFGSSSNAFSNSNAGSDSSSNAFSNSNAGFDSGSNAFSNSNAGSDSSSNAFSGGNAGFDSGSNAFSGGNAGFDSGSTTSDGGNAGFNAGFSSSGNFANNGGSVGVPLPAFGGNDFNANSNSGNGANAGFNTGFSDNSGNSQVFSGNAQFTAESSFGNGQGGFNSNIDFAAKGLSVEIDDGVIKVEASSNEVVRPALRYKLPAQG